MQRVKNFLHHHFTKRELALEEILIIAVCLLLALAAFAAEALLQVQVNIVRCVSQEERIQMCRERSLCCEYIDDDMRVDSNAQAEMQDNQSGDQGE